MRSTSLRLWIVLAAALVLAAPLYATDPIRPGIDLWHTPGDGTTFTNFAADPIPAGFFCENSEAFAGKVAFEGVPVATAEPDVLGATDTIVQRLDTARFNGGGIASTRIQVRALSLASVSPIRTSCGLYNVMVTLDGVQPITRMQIVKTQTDGGYFVAPLALRAKLTFTPVAGQAREARELVQSIYFSRNPREPWSTRLETSNRAQSSTVRVDTDGDLVPDTNLPGRSNFAAGALVESHREAAMTGSVGKMFSTAGCHCDPSGSYAGGGFYTDPSGNPITNPTWADPVGLDPGIHLEPSLPIDGGGLVVTQPVEGTVSPGMSVNSTTECAHYHCPSPVH